MAGCLLTLLIVMVLLTLVTKELAYNSGYKQGYSKGSEEMGAKMSLKSLKQQELINAKIDKATAEVAVAYKHHKRDSDCASLYAIRIPTKCLLE